MPNTDDLYEILQVHHAAEPEVIEAAFKRLAFKYHPDRNNSSQSAEVMTKALTRAYQILKDPAKRAAYDRERSNQRQNTTKRASYDRQRSGQRRNTAKEPPGRSSAWNESKRDDDFSHLSYERRTLLLFTAAIDGDTERFRALISSGVDVNAHLVVASTSIDLRDSNGCTLKRFTAEDDLTHTLAQRLAELGPGADAKDGSGFTPLHYAVKYDNLRIVQMLAAHGADIDAKEQNQGLTPLHIAAGAGNTEMVRKLIRLGANVNAISQVRYTPLDVASMLEQDSTVSVLLAVGAETREQIGRRREYRRL